MGMITKNLKSVELNCECCLEYNNVKDEVIVYRYLYCNRNYQKKFYENLKRDLPAQFV